MFNENEAQSLLDFSTDEFDIALLDNIVRISGDPKNNMRHRAEDFLISLKDNPDMWMRAATIIDGSNSPQTRFFGLQILECVIQTRWRTLPDDQRQGIRNYAVGRIIDMSSENLDKIGFACLRKFNEILIEILKRDWPNEWPTFISEIVSSAESNERICVNNLCILRMFSEEIFDSDEDRLSSDRRKRLRESFTSEFADVFRLCMSLLENGDSMSDDMILACLKTLEGFLTWISPAYVFESNLLELLCEKYLLVDHFRIQTVECLIQIGSITPDDKYMTKINYLMCQSTSACPIDMDKPLYEKWDDLCENDQIFVKRMSLFYCQLLRTNQHLLEMENIDGVMDCMRVLVRISEVDDVDMFRICLDYWHYISHDLYLSEPRQTSYNNTSEFLVKTDDTGRRRSVYESVLSQIRLILINKMAKPEEVIIVIDENGQVIREKMQDTDVLVLYKTMREALVFLTHLNCEDSEDIMLRQLSDQMNNVQRLDWNKLNTLCWAVGSVSGVMSEPDEKRFLVSVIKDLLKLCEQSFGKDNKAVIASDIMYIVGQYPRFLRAHWKFLRTVVNKLFEFMHESHPGVQDMSCDTFLKIANKCRHKFVTQQPEESQPYIHSLIADLGNITSDLTTAQTEVVYDAIALMLSSSRYSQVNRSDVLLDLMTTSNRDWQCIMEQASNNSACLNETSVIHDLITIIKVNIRVCKSVEGLYVCQLKTIYLDVMNVYEHYSNQISAAVDDKGPIAAQMYPYSLMRHFKSHVMELLIQFFMHTGGQDAPVDAVASAFLPRLLEIVPADYHSAVSTARDYRVLMMFGSAIDCLKQYMVQHIQVIVDALFQSTLELITQNMEDNIDHRKAFFCLIKSASSDCFEGLISISIDVNKVIIDSIVWAIRHMEREIADAGLEILDIFLQNVSRYEDLSQSFYREFLEYLLQEILAVLTDREHKTGFRGQAIVFRHLIMVVIGGRAKIILDQSERVHDNRAYLKEFIMRIVLDAFTTVNKSQVNRFIESIFNQSSDIEQFKTCLRDFLIQLKEFSGEDNSGLYLEDVGRELDEKNFEMDDFKKSVPGLMRPADIHDDGGDEADNAEDEENDEDI